MIVPIKDKGKKLISSSRDVFEIIKAVLSTEDKTDRDKEHLWVLHLNARSQIKLLELVGLGTLNSCHIHPREVFTRAVACRAAAVILAHNHPSGNAQPSEEDIGITRKLVDAGNLLDIPVYDHIIVTANNFESLKQSGLI